MSRRKGGRESGLQVAHHVGDVPHDLIGGREGGRAGGRECQRKGGGRRAVTGVHTRGEGDGEAGGGGGGGGGREEGRENE